MKQKSYSVRFGMKLFGRLVRSSTMRFGLIVAVMVLLQPNFVLAHPGHDHQAPQTGIMHWLLAPTHAIPIVACLGLAVGFAIWKFRSVSRKSNTINLDASNS